MEVHRCRFADYVPSAINSLQFAPATASTKYPYLAVGRANGEIELWNSRAGFTLEKVIPGGSGKNNGGTNLEAVAWAHQVHLTADDLELFDEPEEREERVQRLRKAPPRLFSAGLNAAVIEWDLGTLSPKKVVDSYGGSVWCMAVNHAQTILAIGTEDGRVRLFDIVDNSLSYARSFDSINTRILCMAWLPDDDGIVTGSADGTIRRWDVSTGHCLSRMTVERDGSDPSLIWSILALSDSTIVSGDSRGYVTFWDGRMDVISQKFNTHGADVLCLVADKAGNAVYCSGVDPKVVVLHRQSARGKNRRSGSKWVMAGFRRYHTNDVRAIAVDTTRPVDALVTGGVDTQMAVCPADKFPNQPQRRMPCFPPMRCRVMSVASGARLFMQQHRNQLKVWRLGAAQPIPQDRRDQMETGHSMPVIKEPQMLLQMDLKTSSTLICSAISSDGTWIAASDNTQIKLFYVRTEDDMPGDQDFLSVKKVQDFPPANLIPVNLELKYATQLAFTPDGGKLIVTTAECMVVVIGISRLESGEWEFTVLRRFAHHRASEDERDDDHENNHDGLTVLPEVSHCTQDANMRAVRTMNSLAISPDGRWLATGDSLNRFHVFDLASLQHQAAVPQLSSAIANPHTAVTFRCHPHESRLVFATANKEIYEWDVETKDLSSWSKHYSHSTLPESFTRVGDKISAIITNPEAEPDCVYLWCSNFICRVDLTKPPGDVRSLLNVTKRKHIEQAIFNQVSTLREAAKERARQKHLAAKKRNGSSDRADSRDAQQDSKGGESVVQESSDDDAEWEEMMHARLHEAGIVDADEVPNFGMLTRYQSIMACQFLEPNELVVVERSWAELAASLPPAFYRHKYGT